MIYKNIFIIIIYNNNNLTQYFIFLQQMIFIYMLYVKKIKLRRIVKIIIFIYIVK